MVRTASKVPFSTVPAGQYVSASFASGSSAANLTNESSPLLASASSASVSAETSTDLDALMERFRALDAWSLRSRKAKVFTYILAAICAAAGPICFSSQAIIADHVAHDFFPWLPQYMIGAGYWAGLSFFSIMNAFTVIPNFIKSCKYYFSNRAAGLKLAYKDFKRQKALGVVSTIFNLAMVGALVGSMDAASAGVMDAYQKWASLLNKLNYLMPYMASYIATFASALFTNGYFIFMHFLKKLIYILPNIGRSMYACFCPKKNADGFLYTAEKGGDRHAVLYHARQRFLQVRDQNLSDATHLAQVYGQVLKNEGVKTSLLNKLNEKLSPANKLTKDSPVFQRVLKHFAAYAVVRKLNDAHYDKYKPKGTYTAFWGIARIVFGVGLGVAGSLTNGIAGLDAGAKTLSNSVFAFFLARLLGSLQAASVILAVTSLLANLIINIFTAILLANFVYSLVPRVISQLCRRRGNPDPFRNQGMKCSEWLLNLSFVALAAFPALMGWGGIFGLTLEMIKNVSLFQGLSPELSKLLAILPASAQVGNILFAYVNKAFNGIKVAERHRRYGDFVSENFDNIHAKISSDRKNQSAAANEASDQCLNGIEDHQAAVRSMSPPEFEAERSLFEDVYNGFEQSPSVDVAEAQDVRIPVNDDAPAVQTAARRPSASPVRFFGSPSCRPPVFDIPAVSPVAAAA